MAWHRRANGRPLSRYTAPLALAACAVILMAVASPTARHALVGAFAPATARRLVYMSKESGENFRQRIVSLDLWTGRTSTLARDDCSYFGTGLDPSGKRIAYCNTGTNSIWVLDLASGRRTRALQKYGYAPAGWSLRGNLLVTHYESTDQAVFELNGHSLRPYYDPGGTFSPAAMVPLAGDVVAVANLSRLLPEHQAMVLLRGGRTLETVPLAAPLATFDQGRKLLYAHAQRDHVSALGVLSRKRGRFVFRRTSIRGDFSAAAGPGELVALTGAKEGDLYPSLYLLNTRSLEMRRLARGHWLAWAPDGKAILYFRDGAVRLTDLAGHTRVILRGEATGIPPDPDAETLNVTWSPDNRFVYWNGSEIWAADLHGHSRELVRAGNVNVLAILANSLP